MDYQGSKKDLLEKIGVDQKTGLSSSEAKTRLEKYGPNSIESSNKKSMLQKILDQIIDPMVILLIVCLLYTSPSPRD